MPRFVLFKHYRGTPEHANPVPMSEWSEQEVADHLAYMERFADKLRATGEYVDSHALAPEAELVSGQGVRAVPEDKALVAGWMLIDVADLARARELAVELGAAPGKGGEPVGEWLELRALYGEQ